MTAYLTAILLTIYYWSHYREIELYLLEIDNTGCVFRGAVTATTRKRPGRRDYRPGRGVTLPEDNNQSKHHRSSIPLPEDNNQSKHHRSSIPLPEDNNQSKRHRSSIPLPEDNNQAPFKSSCL
jgi:hypothetical protein